MIETNKNTGLWISQEILDMEDLSLQEKFILAKIASLDNEEGCFATNNHFSKLIKLKGTRVSNIVNSLIKKRHVISLINPKNNQRVLHKCVRRITENDNSIGLQESVIPLTGKCNTPLHKSATPPYNIVQAPLTGKCKHNIYINKELNKDYNKELEQSEIPLEENFVEAKEEKTSINLEAQKEKTKNQRRSTLKPKVTAHLFVESAVVDFSIFEKSFENTDYNSFDLKFYYESVKNWSASSGSKRIDWVSTTRGFMLRDIQVGKQKMKQNIELIQNANGITNTANKHAAGNNGANQTKCSHNQGHGNFDLKRTHELVNSLYSDNSPYREMLAYGIPKQG